MVDAPWCRSIYPSRHTEGRGEQDGGDKRAQPWSISVDQLPDERAAKVLPDHATVTGEVENTA